ncbi:hypothetical protein HZC09_06635 [Candidatus Micrarchaeota archaeon]|nr:hypothetical protein [Candidatus Micrarchaeota archaeon]
MDKEYPFGFGKYSIHFPSNWRIKKMGGQDDGLQFKRGILFADLEGYLIGGKLAPKEAKRLLEAKDTKGNAFFEKTSLLPFKNARLRTFPYFSMNELEQIGKKIVFLVGTNFFEIRFLTKSKKVEQVYRDFQKILGTLKINKGKRPTCRFSGR